MDGFAFAIRAKRALNGFRWLDFARCTTLVLALFAAGCGVPGEPLPPLLELPAPVQDLAAIQVGNQIHLVWTTPQLTTEQTRVRQLDRMEIFEVLIPAEEGLGNFAEKAHLLATLRGSELPGLSQPAAYDAALTSANFHQKAYFAVKAINQKNKEAGFSNIASVEIAPLPQPPVELKATVTEKAIELAWKSSPDSVFGGAALEARGYQVYRADTQSLQPAEQIGTADGTSYDDASFEFGHTYNYFVRAFVHAGASTAVTPPSGTVAVAALDVFPPAPPRNVRAISIPGAIELAWSPNSEPDLAGYNVYRRNGDAFTKLNEQPLVISTFRDTTVRSATPYVYRIRAVDKNRNESAPSEDALVTTE